MPPRIGHYREYPPPPGAYLAVKFPREELEKTPLKLWQALPDQRVFIAKHLYDARVIPNPHSPGETYLPAKFPREELEKTPREVVAGTAGSACVDH